MKWTCSRTFLRGQKEQTIKSYSWQDSNSQSLDDEAGALPLCRYPHIEHLTISLWMMVIYLKKQNLVMSFSGPECELINLDRL